MHRGAALLVRVFRWTCVSCVCKKKNRFHRSFSLPGMTSGWDFSLSFLVKKKSGKTVQSVKRRHTKVSRSCRLCYPFFFFFFSFCWRSFCLGTCQEMREKEELTVFLTCAVPRCHERVVSCFFFNVACFHKVKGVVWRVRVATWARFVEDTSEMN